MVLNQFSVDFLFDIVYTYDSEWRTESLNIELSSSTRQYLNIVLITGTYEFSFWRELYFTETTRTDLSMFIRSCEVSKTTEQDTETPELLDVLLNLAVVYSYVYITNYRTKKSNNT